MTMNPEQASAWNELAQVLIEEQVMRPKAKVHKRDAVYKTRATCGAKTKCLTDVNAEVTCKSCRGWFPVGEREVPRDVCELSQQQLADLEAELRQLEAEDPKVAAARKRLDDVTDAILAGRDK